MLHFNKVSFSYSREELIFRELDFEIQHGEFLCILGSSGAGKSTFLNLMAGIIRPTAGQIAYKVKPEIGFVFQDYSLYPWLNVENNAAFGLKLKGMKKNERLEKTREVLKDVQLYEHRHKFPHQLSGGMKQRVAIARAIANDSNLLLMDEPFGALDQTTRTEMQDFVQNLWINAKTSKNQISIIFITHNIEEAYLLGDRILVFGAGKPVKMVEKFITTPHKERDIFTDGYGNFRKEILEII